MRNVNGAMLLRFHKWSLAAAALLGAGLAQNAFAQSTGTEAVEEDMGEVVVSATRVRNIGIVGDQTAPKSRVIADAANTSRRRLAGQSVFQALNQIPGVNFTNSDPYGTSGGNLRIRGFDGSRVSVTFDGVPLNDSGNYALFTNQMLDSGAHRPRRREPRHHRRRQPDGVGDRRHGGLSHAATRRTSSAARPCSRAATSTTSARSCASTPASSAPGAPRRSSPASYQKYDKFKGPGELEKKQFNAVVRQDFENEQLHQPRRSTTTKTATRSTARPARRTSRSSAATTTTSRPARAMRRPPAFADNDNDSPIAATTPDAARTPTTRRTRRAAPTTTACASTRRTPATSACSRCGTSATSLQADVRPVVAVHDGERRRQHRRSPKLPAPTASTCASLGARNGIRLRSERRRRPARHRPLLHAQHHEHASLGRHRSLIWDINDDNRLRFAYTWDRARHRQTAQWGPHRRRTAVRRTCSPAARASACTPPTATSSAAATASRSPS